MREPWLGEISPRKARTGRGRRERGSPFATTSYRKRKRGWVARIQQAFGLALDNLPGQSSPVFHGALNQLMARTKKENVTSSNSTAMVAFERDNPRLKDVLPKDDARPGLGNRADMLSELDWSVGEVMKTLERLGLAKNTLVIFSSDNGASPTNEHGHLPNGPWRGKKSQLWEGGHREPFIARWPGHIAPGTTSDDLVCLVDLAATAAAVAGEKLPDGAAPDSFNLLPTLLGQPKQMKRDTLRRGEVRNQNYEGRIRPQGAHQAVCAAHHPPVRKPAEIDGGSGARQTTAPLRNLRRGELSGSPSRTKQGRIHRKVRRLAAGTRRISVLAGTARRWRDRASGKAAIAPCRVRRTDSDFRYDHQESPRLGLTDFLPSSFLLQTLPRLAIRQGQWKYLPNLALADGWQSGPKKPNQPAQPALFDLSTDQGETKNLAQQTALRDSALLQSGASSQVVSEAKDKPPMARRMAELLEKAQCAKSTRPSSP